MIAFGDFDVLSFDCYGTLIDWETGLVQALHPILQAHGVQQGDEEVLAAYAVAEAAAEGGAYQGYRAVLATALRDLGALYRFTPSPEELERFATSVGDWPAFPDTPGALARLARRFKLAVITNCDDDESSPGVQSPMSRCAITAGSTPPSAARARTSRSCDTPTNMRSATRLVDGRRR